MMFFKKVFVFFLPKIDKYKVIKARDESEAVYILCKHYLYAPSLIENFKIINYDVIR